MYDQLSECKLMKQRKYRYPSNMIRKDGRLMKNKKRQILSWRQNIQINYLNVDKYTDLLLENKQLQTSIKEYQIALEEWVLCAQIRL